MAQIIHTPHKFFHVTISFRQEEPKFQEMKEILNNEEDWIFYARGVDTGSLLVYSRKSPDELATAIHAKLGAWSIVFVVEVNLSQRQGWLDKWMWEWINKKR